MKIVDQDPLDRTDPPDEDVIETALAGLDQSWSRRERLWVISMPRSATLLVEAVSGGVVVRAELATFEQLPPDVAETITQFLNDSLSRFPDVRAAWSSSSVSLERFVPLIDLDEQFVAAVPRVADVRRRLSSPVQALLAPRLSAEYRMFLGLSSLDCPSGELVSVSP